MALIVAVALPGCVWFGNGDDSSGADEAFVAPLMAGSDLRFDQLCEVGACVSDLVVLPLRRFVHSASDLELPPSLGAMTVERMWTGERSGLFGAGWESVWDVRFEGGRLVGPVPARPLDEPRPGGLVRFSDGTELEFGDDGRVVQACAADAICTAATWTDDGERSLVLTPPNGGSSRLQISIDDAGLADRVESVDGRATSYVYEDGYLVSVDGPTGVTQYGYDESGRLTSVDAHRDARSVTYASSDPDDLTVSSMVDRDGLRWEFSAPVPGRIEVVAAGVADRTYRFDDDRLIEINDRDRGLLLRRTYRDGVLVREERLADGVTMEIVGDGRIEITEMVDGLPPRRVVHRVDPAGRLIETESRDGLWRYSYDEGGLPTSLISATGTTSFSYDDNGLLMKSVDADGYTVTIERDERGLPVSVSDGVLSTLFEHDDAGRVVAETNGDQVVRASYADDGTLVRATDAAGNETIYRNGAFGRLEAVEGPFGVTDLSYDETGSLDSDTSRLLSLADLPEGTAADDPLALSANDDGTYTVTDGTGRATFDEWGRPIETEMAGALVRREYDDTGRLIRLAEPGRTFDVTYTAAGRVATIDVDDRQVEFEWHGDLLTGLSLPDGSSVTYDYDASGAVRSASNGSNRWDYQYSAAGLLAEMVTPAGAVEYTWDSNGRPSEVRAPSGQVRSFEWSGHDLTEVNQDGTTVMSLERDEIGRVIRIVGDEDETHLEYDDEGRVVGYRLAGGAEGSVRYANDQVERISLEGHVEQWHLDGDQLTAIEVGETDDAELFELEWLAPGLLSSVLQSGARVLTTVQDERRRITSIRTVETDASRAIASFQWDDFGITNTTVGDDEITIVRDAVGRLISVGTDEFDLTVSRDSSGSIVGLADEDHSQRFAYDDGRLTSSGISRGDDDVGVEWDPGRHQPQAFTTPDGVGTLVYDHSALSTVTFNDDQWDVDYDDQGQPRAGGAAGRLLDDLFNDQGQFVGPASGLRSGPDLPILDEFPAELGISTPSVVTPDDVIAAAVETSIPPIPLPLMAGGIDVVAEQLTTVILNLGATVDVPVGPTETMTVTIRGDGNDLAGLLTAGSLFGVAERLHDQFTPGPCVLCRVVDFGASVISGIGSAAVSVYRFVVDNPVTRALMSITFVVASFIGLRAAVGLCPDLACRAALVLGVLILSELALGSPTSVGDLLYSITVQPIIGLVRGVIELDAVAIAASAAVIASIFTGGAILRSSALRRRANSAVCSFERVICVSAARHGPAAAHITAAQRAGAGRIYTIDRSGASARRATNLRGIERRAGFDRDEIPPASMIGRRPTAHVTYIEPWANRGAGASIGRQISMIPDGSRVWLRAI